MENQKYKRSFWSKLANDWIIPVCEISLCVISFFTSLYGFTEFTRWAVRWAVPVVLPVQLLVYFAAHPLDQSALLEPGYKFYKSPRFIVWAACLCFSVSFSAVGFFEATKGTLDKNRERVTLQTIWQNSTGVLNQFRGDALAHLRQQIAEADRQISREQRRIDAAVARRRAYSTRQRDVLVAGKGRMEGLITQIEGAPQLGDAAPTMTTEEMRQKLRETFTRATEFYAGMDQAFRDNHNEPRQLEEQLSFTDSHDVYFQQLWQGTTKALFCFFFALIFDLIPVLSLRSRTPMRSLAKLIRDGKASWSQFRAAIKRTSKVERLRIIVEGFAEHELDIGVEFAADNGNPSLRDLQHHFEDIESKVTDAVGRPMQIASLMSSTGLEILPDMPLKFQIENDHTIRLRLEPVPEGVKPT